MGDIILDELLAEREKIDTIAKNIIDQKTEAQRIKVPSVTTRDILIS
ncbi:MAG: hypothetical protein QXE05_12045 [Nitrososphaeria archaeon]